MATTCILCGEPGKPRICCDDHPVFCDEHDAVHQRRVHADAPTRSIDDALVTALEAGELDDESDENEEPNL